MRKKAGELNKAFTRYAVPDGRMTEKYLMTEDLRDALLQMFGPHSLDIARSLVGRIDAARANAVDSGEGLDLGLHRQEEGFTFLELLAWSRRLREALQSSASRSRSSTRMAWESIRGRARGRHAQRGAHAAPRHDLATEGFGETELDRMKRCDMTRPSRRPSRRPSPRTSRALEATSLCRTIVLRRGPGDAPREGPALQQLR